MTRPLTAIAGLAVFLCQCYFVGALLAQDPWDVEVLDPGLPATLNAGETIEARITLLNRGTEEWDPESGFAAAAHWLSVDGDVVFWEGIRTPLNQVVRPGSTVTIDATLQAPRQAGTFIVQWDVLQEGVFWITSRDPTPVIGVAVDVYRKYSFALLEISQPRIYWPGTRPKTRIVLENDGAVEWAADGTFGAVGHWRRIGSELKTMDGPRIRFSTPVKTGESVELQGVLRPPEMPGPWLLQWDLVRENVCFFSQRMDNPPPSSLVLVMPKCLNAWFCVVLTGLIVLVHISHQPPTTNVGEKCGLVSRRRSGCIRSVAGKADLAWLVFVVFVIERSIIESSFGGGVVTFLCLAAVAALVALTGERVRPWLAWFVGLLMIVMFVGDRIYLRFFSDLPSVGSLHTMGQTDEIGRSIITLFDQCDVLFLLTGLSGVGIALTAQVIVPSFRRRVIAATLMSAMAGGGLWWAAERPIHRQVFRRVFVAKETGVLGARLLDFGRAARDRFRQTVVSAEEIDRIERWFLATGESRRGIGSTFGSARDMNLVMVQAESVQEFAVGLEIGGRLVMPNLTRWATEGLRFSEVSDQTGHGRSSDAELISQTSLLPLADGAAAFQTATNSYTSLAGVLAGLGYRTLSAVPFDGAFWNRATTHRAYGYQSSLFGSDFEPGQRIGWGLGDRDFLSQMGDRLVEMPQPFCAWMLTLSLHHPFEGFPDELEVLDVGRWSGGPVGEYLHTMYYLDLALGDLESRLHAAGLLDQTLIVVWGDHDAGFEWEPEIAGLMGQSTDQSGWYRSQRIPLIIKAPRDLGIQGMVTTPAGHLDIAPTIAGLMGIDGSELAWMGRNLLGSPGDHPVVGEYGCWTNATHVFLQGESGTLQGGRCLERPSLSRLPVSECDEGFEAARDRVAVAQDVLRFDLQERLTARLGVSDR